MSCPKRPNRSPSFLGGLLLMGGCVGGPRPASLTAAEYAARIDDGAAFVLASRAYSEVRGLRAPVDCAAALGNPRGLRPEQFGPVAPRFAINAEDGNSAILELAAGDPGCGVALVRVTHDTFLRGLVKSDPFYVVWDRAGVRAARRALPEAQKLAVGVVHSELRGGTALVTAHDPSVHIAPAPKEAFEK